MEARGPSEGEGAVGEEAEERCAGGDGEAGYLVPLGKTMRPSETMVDVEP